MQKMLEVAEGFQYSVNIGFDLNDDAKLKNFIPTQSALRLLESILQSTAVNSTDRARVLVGAYGKGKSHIVLTILSLLLKKNLSLFPKLMESVKQNEKLYQSIINYYESDKKILPVVITGSNTSIPQAFLLALQRTLAENDMLDIMPETNYKAACEVIKRWEKEYPAVYQQFAAKIAVPVEKFLARLEDFDVLAYEKFERLYPALTAGSIFNPFLGFDVIDLYENAVKGLKTKGYTGIYVVYDEFSKFLEANITEASVSDTKMLQDFAEKCNRSGALQLHLMLISHKEIANYLDKLPKQKLDGWRGVSDRFSHIHLNNNFAQTYSIIAAVINKNPAQWQAFCAAHQKQFAALSSEYLQNTMFSDVTEEEYTKLIYGCYPLHPVSTFILPRLSERVAQNERTLFTFLSAKGVSTLASYLERCNQEKFALITPDIIYDYFEPLFKKEVYTSDLHDKYVLATAILEKLEADSLEAKIVKTIALIYILEQYEKLTPTKETVMGIYAKEYGLEGVKDALNNLIEKELVVYLRQSNKFLRLKRSSGVNIIEKIHDTVVAKAGKIAAKDILNQANFDNYIYPFRHNDEKEITRFFAFEFISAAEVRAETNWQIKSEGIKADGVVYAIIPEENSDLAQLQADVLASSVSSRQCVFILPKTYKNIEQCVREFYAVSLLKDAASDEPLLFDEYEVVYDDLREVISKYINTFTHPENYQAQYYYQGELKKISRKASLTELLSLICDTVFPNTPKINNEAINKNELTSVANNSRNKIVAGLLRNDLEANLGMAGSGQEVSIMRSTLMKTGILAEDALGQLYINLQPADSAMRNMLNVIIEFINQAKTNEKIFFAKLYEQLASPVNGIGLRLGVIPIYLAAVFHEYKQQLIIEDRYGQVNLSAELLQQINAAPENYTISYLAWDEEKSAYVERLAELFADNIVEADCAVNAYDYVYKAMRRWYLALPKYSKETKKNIYGEAIDKRFLKVLKLLKQELSANEVLFKELPLIWGYTELKTAVCQEIEGCKKFYDAQLGMLKHSLAEEVKQEFSLPAHQERMQQLSLASVIKDWCDNLEQAAFEELFNDGTDRCLALFKTVGNDEGAFIASLARLAVGLRLEDWDDKTFAQFKAKLEQYKQTAVEFHSEKNTAAEKVGEAASYQLTFIDDNGAAVTKRFNKVAYSKRGKLLFNALNAEIEAMGQSITEQEKRQILMEVIKKLC